MTALIALALLAMASCLLGSSDKPHKPAAPVAADSDDAADERTAKSIEADARDIYERYGIPRPTDESPVASRLGRERRAALREADEDKEAEEAARRGE
jgi:hypothetical protein